MTHHERCAALTLLLLGWAAASGCGDNATVVVPGMSQEPGADMRPREDLGAPSTPLTDMHAARDAAPSAPDMRAPMPDMRAPAPEDLGPAPLADMGPGWIGAACSVDGRGGTCQEVSDCQAPQIATPGRCPGPSHIQCCTPPPQDPDPGECQEGDNVRPNTNRMEAPGDAGCPAGMARITTFCIDRHEASLVEIPASGPERSWSPYRNPGQAEVRAVSIAGAVPQGYINGEQAARACQRADKRLCTDQEWLRACRGPGGQNYPYGTTERTGACNASRDMHPAIEYFGTSADWIWSELGHPCINQQADTVAPAGAHAECVSAEGAFDMVGNLHEWTAAASGTFRGGFYADTQRNGPGCEYATTAHSRGHWDYSTGFRCCADPEP